MQQLTRRSFLHNAAVAGATVGAIASPRALFADDKKDPPPPGPIAITLGPDGMYRGDGILTDADPLNPLGRAHKAYQIEMQAGMTYQIDLGSADKLFPKLLAEALQPEQSLDVSFKYFWLEK